MKNLIITFLLFLLSQTICFSQINAVQQSFLKEVKAKYNQAKSYQMLVVSKTYDAINPKPFLTDTSAVVVKGKNYRVDAFGMVTIKSEKHLLFVDHRSKSIRLNELSIEQQNQAVTLENVNKYFIDELSSNTYSVQETEREIILTQNADFQFLKVIYTFSKKNKTLIKVDYFMDLKEVNQSAHVVVEYLVVKIDEKIDENEFLFDDFILLDSEQLYKPNKKYVDYDFNFIKNELK